MRNVEEGRRGEDLGGHCEGRRVRARRDWQGARINRNADFPICAKTLISFERWNERDQKGQVSDPSKREEEHAVDAHW